MERKITKLENSHVEVVVTAEEEAWKKAQDKAFDKLAANVEIDGFRKGKAPKNLVRAKIDPMKVFDDAVNLMLPEMYREIIEIDQIKPFAQPKVEVVGISDTTLEVKFTIVTEPEVELGEYKNLEIGHNEVNVSDDEVELAVKKISEENATLVLKEDAAELGDTVVMDFVGTINGEPFDGGAANNHELELGSHQFIPGFEEQLVGVKPGEHRVVKVKFPENYVEELKGKDAEFACDIHEIKAKQYPELTDDLVKEQNIPNVSSVDQLKAYKRDELQKEKEKQERSDYIRKALDLIIKSSKLSIPDEIIEEQMESRREDFNNQLAQSGLNLEQYLNIIGQTEEQFNGQLREDSLKSLNEFLVLNAFCS